MLKDQLKSGAVFKNIAINDKGIKITREFLQSATT